MAGFICAIIVGLVLWGIVAVIKGWLSTIQSKLSYLEAEVERILQDRRILEGKLQDYFSRYDRMYADVRYLQTTVDQLKLREKWLNEK